MQLDRMAFPAFAEAASISSRRAQSTYKWGIRGCLALMVAASAVSCLDEAFPNGGRTFAAIAATLFAIDIIAGLVLQNRGYLQRWHGWRAVAESTKSMTWKFAMRAEPYASESGEALFLADLRTTLAERARSIPGAIEAPLPGEEEYPPAPQEWRDRSVGERLAFYLEARVRDQVDWYSAKAQDNGRADRWSFLVLLGFQGAAFLFGLTRVGLDLPSGPMGFLATLATALMAWTLVQDHPQLQQSYAIAAHELRLVQERSRAVLTEADLARFVADAENAISREHTGWLARRQAREG